MMKVKTRSHDHEICFFLSKLFNVNFENTIVIYLLLVFHCSVFRFSHSIIIKIKKKIMP